MIIDLDFDCNAFWINASLDSLVGVRCVVTSEYPLPSIRYDNDVFSLETLVEDSDTSVCICFAWKNIEWSEQYENHLKWIKQAYER
jgi:hypothetical protein